MPEEDTVSILRCGDCNKPFNKESTLKRHGYYCRSRRTSSTLKSRSCVSCARRKIRCDKTQPQCSRCKAKGVECQYVTRLAKPTRRNPQTSHKLSTAKTSNASPTLLTRMSFHSHPSTNNDDDTTRDSSLVISGDQFAGVEGDALNWDNPHIDFSDFLNPEFNESIQEPPSLCALTDYPTTTSMIDRVQSINCSIPAQPTSNPRSLNQRPKTRPGTQRTTTLIQHTLKSYLLTMLRHNSLPPFIHSSLASTTFELEPLDNCISLVYMISSGTRGSRKLFWRNVRMECERLCSECGGFTNWGLLASMQAVTIYILFRLDEGETEQNDFDPLLLATVTIIAQQLTQKDIASNYSLERSWKDWLYEESRRRLAVIYRIVNMLVYFDPATMCNLPSDLILAPLPAKKELWEAGDEQVWNSESEKNPGARSDFGLAKGGGLVRLGDGVQDAVLVHTAITSESPSRTSVSWAEWCSGMDGFGGLVMLAASLVVE